MNVCFLCLCLPLFVLIIQNIYIANRDVCTIKNVERITLYVRYIRVLAHQVQTYDQGPKLQQYLLQIQKIGYSKKQYTEYSYNIYDNGTNQSSTMNVLGNYIKCNFREFDYIISVHVIRYMYDIDLIYNFLTFI